ncbi:MAG: hypothetical protein JXQ73_32445 [Phycisphaerae bacterium]|nr:hypothetical protein [Phycisphaerae bacterium]
MHENRSHQPKRARAGRSWRLLAAAGLLTGSLGGCIATIQRELEVLFAPDALQNALYVPQSILYQVFGQGLWQLIDRLR